MDKSITEPKFRRRYSQLLKAIAEGSGIKEIAGSEPGTTPLEVQQALRAGAEALCPEVIKLKAYIDGASRGNPGKAGAGVVIYGQDGNVVEEEFLYLGEATNNVAEYSALLLALELGKKKGAREFEVFSDSELVVKQINGQYRVKNPSLKTLFREVVERASGFNRFSIQHIPRSQNRRADGLANKAIDMAPE